ncbi:hypothetical protein AB8880_00770 [Alphaproteobacteria bacterium LSUCC0684]
MRNVFDQYSQNENKLTHALFAALNNDPDLLACFIKNICGVSPPKSPELQICVQTYPWAKNYPDGDSKARNIRNIPDAWIFDEKSEFTMVFEAKITAPLDENQLKGHEDIAKKYRPESNSMYFFTIVGTIPTPGTRENAKSGAWTELYWSDIYLWLRKKPCKKPSIWAKHAADFFELLETRMMKDGKMHNTAITEFDGFPKFENDYSYSVAKLKLRQAMAKLRENTDLITRLGMDPEHKGRASITGSRERGVWDIIKLNSGPEEKSSDKFMHLTLSLSETDVMAEITIPNGLNGPPRKRLKELGKDGFRDVCLMILNKMDHILRDNEKATPKVGGYQRRYKSQGAVPDEDAILRFDLRTALVTGAGSRQEQKFQPKFQPQWLDALYDVFISHKSNFQFGIGISFKHNDCPKIHTPESLKLIADTWLACEPLISLCKNE